MERLSKRSLQQTKGEKMKQNIKGLLILSGICLVIAITMWLGWFG